MSFSFLISMRYRFQGCDLPCCVEIRVYTTLSETGCLPFLIMKAKVNPKCLNGGNYPKYLYGIKSQKKLIFQNLFVPVLPIPSRHYGVTFHEIYIYIYISKFKLNEKKLLHTNSSLINRTTNTESNLNNTNKRNLLQIYYIGYKIPGEGNFSKFICTLFTHSFTALPFMRYI